MNKEKLRLKLHACLLAIPAERKSLKSRKACQNLISTPGFQNASTIMMYLSLPYEVDTSEAIHYAWQLGKTVVVPKVFWKQKYMLPVCIDSLETGFSTEVANLRNPIEAVPMPFEKIDFVVVPALGFDKKGNRLGHGGGYYDRFLANVELKAYKCGFGFAEQLVDSIPVKEYDEPVDFLVTDEEIMYFDHSKDKGQGE